MEQIHYILKAHIIKYSIAIQRQRTYDKRETEKIKAMNEELKGAEAKTRPPETLTEADFKVL